MVRRVAYALLSSGEGNAYFGFQERCNVLTRSASGPATRVTRIWQLLPPTEGRRGALLPTREWVVQCTDSIGRARQMTVIARRGDRHRTGSLSMRVPPGECAVIEDPTMMRHVEATMATARRWLQRSDAS